jgi:predicted AAA+ superfamily ATPase
MSSFFKAVLVTGARQTGKTTMLKHLAEGQNRTYVTLDNLMARNLAKTDPILFFQTYKPPVIIDEIQYAPELLGQIKIMCDESEETGRFWLTGSQQYSMMKNVGETLAGRLGIMELYSLSKREIGEVDLESEPDFSLSGLLDKQSKRKKTNIVEVYQHIWRGGMPQVLRADSEQRQAYFDSYIDTYLMRDATESGGITDFVRFRRFLTACAALVSEQLNYKKIAEAADISQPTAKEWVRLLEGLGIIYLLRPYFNNQLKRLTKTPKLYFLDTGLCAHLSMWLTPETLMNGAVSSHYFENFVVVELLKNHSFSKSKVNATYYRDANAKEIDLFLKENNQIHPFEIKKSANPDTREVKKFAVLDKAFVERGSGGIICMCEELLPIDGKNNFIPCNLL